MTLRIERYKNTRHWALYDGPELVVVTVYRRGALEVQRRLQAQEPPAVAAPARGRSVRLQRAADCLGRTAVVEEGRLEKSKRPRAADWQSQLWAITPHQVPRG